MKLIFFRCRDGVGRKSFDVEINFLSKLHFCNIYYVHSGTSLALPPGSTQDFVITCEKPPSFSLLHAQKINRTKNEKLGGAWGQG